MFTPIESGIGGLLIGLSAALAYYVDGKIAGISGIMGPFLRSLFTCDKVSEHATVWKGIFLLGLIVGGLVNLGWNSSFAYPQVPDFSPVRYWIAGMLIGFGTRTGKGCTSGHGICGLPRFSLRSWISVPAFMGAAVVVVAITRHGAKVDTQQRPSAVAELPWPPQWKFPVASLGVSIIFTIATILCPAKVRQYVSPFICGLIFGLGLGCSGMTSPDKVLDFLDIGGTWDPSLAFVMGCGLCVSFPMFFWVERKDDRKPLCDGTFEKPPKYGDYKPLVLGALCFGSGWGLIGICPGPAWAAVIPFLVKDISGLKFGLCFLFICLTWVVTDKIYQHHDAIINRLLCRTRVEQAEV
jgi:uncharacterized protein